MAIRIHCPHCGQGYGAEENHLGRSVACRACGRRFAVGESSGAGQSQAERSTGAKPQGKREPGLPAKIGRFEVRSRLAAGAVGEAYRANDPVLDREVVLNVPPQGSLDAQTDRARFLREAKVASQLRHPNIVPVYEVGVDGDTYYVASAFIEGQTLRDAVAAGSFDVDRIATLVMNLADALDHAHRQGIVHRDVRPGNITLDADGDPLLTDFGLARLREGQPNLPKDGADAVAYRSPEQARGPSDQVGPASDQYALGVVMYELLCGRTPFSGPSATVIPLILNHQPASPKAVNWRVPRDLEAICLKAMSKQPSQRFTSCREMADDLRRFLTREPIRARSIGPVERFGRWCRRNPATAVLSAAIIVLLVLGRMASGYFASVASERARAAEEARAQAEESLGKEAEARDQEAEAREQAEESRKKALAETELAENQARLAQEQMNRASAEESRVQQQKARVEQAGQK